ncbi:hypothetical protein [Streptomyces mirabilis]|uniref:hypothetical protein n=1 Tax=Streptomyces mirabilis TaxID=68239 RepID=UPI0036A63F7F
MPTSSPTPEPCGYEPPEPDLYELTWMSGHVEKIVAHDVSFANHRVVFLTDANGRMRISLSALEDDLRTIRCITQDEILLLPGGGELA